MSDNNDHDLSVIINELKELRTKIEQKFKDYKALEEENDRKENECDNEIRTGREYRFFDYSGYEFSKKKSNHETNPFDEEDLVDDTSTNSKLNYEDNPFDRDDLDDDTSPNLTRVIEDVDIEIRGLLELIKSSQEDIDILKQQMRQVEGYLEKISELKIVPFKRKFGD